MRRVTYAGGSFITGDRIVEALVRFAAANANAERSASIELPVISADGTHSIIGIVVGPASQLMYEPVVSDDELEDEGLVARIDGLSDRLVQSSGVNPTP